MTTTNDVSFEQQTAPFRRELLAHCYRITGSTADAEDALQEALVRAWKALPQFEGRSSLRRWLYTIATRTSLDLVGARKRGLAFLDDEFGPATSELGAMPPPRFEPVWLQPFPDDALVFEVKDDGPAPDVKVGARESVRLAFLAALQQLPARQRAALILRDVVGLSADETAEVLEITVAAANSALQRARDAVDNGDVSADVVADEDKAAVVDKFVKALESADAVGLAALLRHDVVYTMPPFALWLRGAAAVRALYERVVFPQGPVVVRVTRANGEFAVGLYQGGTPVALSVLEFAGGATAAIATIHTFLAVDPALQMARFGLPDAL